MISRHDLPDILYKAIKDIGGSTNIVDICKYIWSKYEKDLKASGDLFYTWQYDIRWAATRLRKDGKMKNAEFSPKGVWEVV